MRGPLSWGIIGIYGVVSHAAAWTQEIGLRVEMGPSAGGVAGIFIR